MPLVPLLLFSRVRIARCTSTLSRAAAGRRDRCKERQRQVAEAEGEGVLRSAMGHTHDATDTSSASPVGAEVQASTRRAPLMPPTLPLGTRQAFSTRASPTMKSRSSHVCRLTDYLASSGALHQTSPSASIPILLRYIFDWHTFHIQVTAYSRAVGRLGRRTGVDTQAD
jgi:hypothetical protein